MHCTTPVEIFHTAQLRALLVWAFSILLISALLDWPDALPLPWQMLRVREAVVSLMQLQDSGFHQLSLVVEKGLMQVNLHGTWLPDKKRSHLHGQQGLFPNASHNVSAHDNCVMGTL